MIRSSVVLALLAAFCTIAAASRLDPLDTPWDVVAQASGGGGDVPHYHSGIVIFKITVPPAVAEEFVDKWDSYIGGPASKAKGNNKISLTRPIISNAMYYDYSEWERMEDWAHWMKSKDVQDFQDYAADRDITWEWEILFENAGHHVEKAMDKGRKSQGFSVLSTILAKPHHAENFIAEWRKAAEQSMSKEDSLDVYALHRVASTNFKFYLYGTWSSESAWKDHLDSDYVRDLADWADKHDIVFVESPLRMLSMY